MSKRAPFVVGLTGGIASGKSVVSERLAALGADVVDTDIIAREIVEPGQPAYREIRQHFGPAIIAADGSIDRQSLRVRVFDDATDRAALERITHPRIRAEAWRRVRQSRGPYVVLVVPLLIESGLHGQVDRVLVVDADPKVQLERLLERDAGTEATARAIIAAQSRAEERLAHADDVIVNDGSLDELLLAVDRLHEGYLNLAGLSPNGDE